MINKFKQELEKLKDKDHISKKIMQVFLDRIEKGNLTRDKNSVEHFITMFLPVDVKSKMIYVGHHILADDWIPPGGHIDIEETPLDTVHREFNEELNHKLTDEKIDLFDISILPVRNPLRPCKLHFDLWYMVNMPKTNFSFDKKEFYEARWVTFAQAFAIMERESYKEIIKNLEKSMN